MRIPLSVLLVLLFVPSWSGDERVKVMARHPQVTAHPVALDPNDPARVRVGALTYLGGVQLTSPDPAFGGYSALLVEQDRFTMLSDRGGILRFRMGADWRVSDVSAATLPKGPGRGWSDMEWDSESLARDPADGTMLVGFEGPNAIWRYSADLTRVVGWSAPPAMQRWSSNSGAEAMVVLPDGSVVVLEEQYPERGKRGGGAIRFQADPVAAPRIGYRFSLAAPTWYRPADMATLPDGRLVVLTRAASLTQAFTAKLLLVDPDAIRPGAVIRSKLIATITPPLTRDNLEGVAATREGDDTILWLVSDDNQSLLQRTLLMKFRLDP